MTQEFLVQTGLKFSVFFSDFFRKSGRKFKDLKEEMPDKIEESKKSVADFYQKAKEKLTNFSSQSFSPSPAGLSTSSPSPVPSAQKPGSGPPDPIADSNFEAEYYAISSGKTIILEYVLLITFVLIYKV